MKFLSFTARRSPGRARARARTLAMAAALMLSIAPAARAQTVTIKLGTLIPDGSVWHKILLDMGDEWSRETQGRVALRIYAGGTIGDEPDMVRKMRIGQLQSAALTVKTLAEIDDSFAAFMVPMMFESYDELLYVLKKMEPTLKKRLETKGFVLLNWGHAGWLYFFSKEPVRSVAELKKKKLWVWAGDDRMNQLWKETGYQPVALSATDILTGLQTGMIDVLPAMPIAALQLQWFRRTLYMMDAGLFPLVGGTLVTAKTWNKISEADRAKILEACRKIEARLDKIIPEQDREALAEMKKRGLQVVELTGPRAAEWKAQTETFTRMMRGNLVPGEILDLALRERNAYRQQQQKR